MCSNNEKQVLTSVKTRSTPIKYDKVKAGATGRFFKYYPINSTETEYKS